MRHGRTRRGLLRSRLLPTVKLTLVPGATWVPVAGNWESTIPASSRLNTGGQPGGGDRGIRGGRREANDARHAHQPRARARIAPKTAYRPAARIASEQGVRREVPTLRTRGLNGRASSSRRPTRPVTAGPRPRLQPIGLGGIARPASSAATSRPSSRAGSWGLGSKMRARSAHTAGRRGAGSWGWRRTASCQAGAGRDPQWI